MRASDVAELNSLFAESAGYYPPQTASAAPITPPVYQTNYNQQQPPRQAEPMPKTWLVESILATVLPFLLCSSIFSLFGIIAIVHASKVQSLFMSGDYAGSQEASTQAGKWTKIAMWIAIGWVVLWILAIIMIFVFAGSMAGLGDMLSGSGYTA